MPRCLALALALVACSPTAPSTPARPFDDPSTWSTTRGDPSPPPWVKQTVPALPRGPVEAELRATAAALPDTLADRRLVCAVDVAPNRQSVDGLLDGAADIYTTWTLGDRTFAVLGGDDPGMLFVPVGAVAPGQTWTVKVEDIDAFGPDDVIATLTLALVAGQPVAARSDRVTIDCRAITAERLRAAAAPLLRDELPRAIRRIDPRPDPEDQPEEERNRLIDAARYQLSAAAAVLGWDQPDVWPLVKLLDEAGPPTEGGRPIP